MKTVNEHIRSRLLGERKRIIGYREMRESQWCDEFEALMRAHTNTWSTLFVDYMRNRMVMGGYRYGLITDPTLPQYDNVGSAIARLDLYLRDGNQEHLVDAANLALVEYVRGCCHPNPWLSKPTTMIRSTVDNAIMCGRAYVEFGNQRFLAMMAAACMNVFLYKSDHPNPHFSPIDDGYHTEVIKDV